MPLVIALGRGYNPFLFGSAMRLGIAILVLAILIILYWLFLKEQEIYSFIR